MGGANSRNQGIGFSSANLQYFSSPAGICPTKKQAHSLNFNAQMSAMSSTLSVAKLKGTLFMVF